MAPSQPMLDGLGEHLKILGLHLANVLATTHDSIVHVVKRTQRLDAPAGESRRRLRLRQQRQARSESDQRVLAAEGDRAAEVRLRHLPQALLGLVAVALRHLEQLRRHSQVDDVEGRYEDVDAVTEVGDESERVRRDV